MRPGEALETVPGVIITQHSGAGKANQFFLRGFNLDHGTDFATSVAGMPVNFPTHGHGQGYTDLNFLIPELISRIDYRKGPYYAEAGDFSAAGTAHIDYAETLERATSPNSPRAAMITTVAYSLAPPHSEPGTCSAPSRSWTATAPGTTRTITGATMGYCVSVRAID